MTIIYTQPHPKIKLSDGTPFIYAMSPVRVETEVHGDHWHIKLISRVQSVNCDCPWGAVHDMGDYGTDVIWMYN